MLTRLQPNLRDRCQYSPRAERWVETRKEGGRKMGSVRRWVTEESQESGLAREAGGEVK